MKIQLKTPTLVTLTINGRQVETSSDKTLLQAIAEQGIHIPHLCYDTRLIRSNGSCGLCVVQVRSAGEPNRRT
jgi:formate dehydrogenase major subunit